MGISFQIKQTAWSLVYVVGWSVIIPGFLESNLILTCYLTVSVTSNCSKRWYWTHSIITHIETTYTLRIYLSKNPSFCFKISRSVSKYMKKKKHEWHIWKLCSIMHYIMVFCDWCCHTFKLFILSTVTNLSNLSYQRNAYIYG